MAIFNSKLLVYQRVVSDQQPEPGACEPVGLGTREGSDLGAGAGLERSAGWVVNPLRRTINSDSKATTIAYTYGGFH